MERDFLFSIELSKNDIMTKEETLKRIEFLKRKIEKNNEAIDTKNVTQLALKLMINSAYGGISSRSNPLGDDDLANAITVMGSESIQKINDIAVDFVKQWRIKNGLKDLSNVDLKKCLVFNDTDSAGVSLDLCEVHMFDGDKITDEGYKLIDGFSEFVNVEFEKWYKKTTNSKDCRLYFKREKVCDAGLYLEKGSSEEEAKKNYVLHILDDEGVKHPKFKYTGVKFAKSIIPTALKDAGKRIVEHMILSNDRVSTDRLVQDLYKQYCEMPLDDRSSLQRCNNIEKWIDTTNSDGYRLGTPGHVRAAIRYNNVLKDLGVKKHKLIESGENAKIVFVESNNKYGFDKIAYAETWPEEFNEIFTIDTRTGFEKLIYDEIKRFYKSMKWPAFNPAQNYEFSLYDILGL